MSNRRSGLTNPPPQVGDDLETRKGERATLTWVTPELVGYTGVVKGKTISGALDRKLIVQYSRNNHYWLEKE